MKELSVRSRGPQVEMLQLALKRAGYDIAADGIFGRRTLDALAEFQREAGLKADGIAGRRTWAALDPYLAGYMVHETAAGDTFYNIARRYGTTVSAIETANPEISAANLPVGASVVVPLSFDVVPQISYSSALMSYIMRGLKARYPFMETGSIGTSVLGNPIYYLKLGSGRKSVGYNASHHANEWLTTPVLMRFAEQYAKAMAEGGSLFGADVSSLSRRVSVTIVPMVNPDGVDLVTGDIAEGSAAYEAVRRIAEGFPDIRFPEGWKANIAGTDLNLNYPAGWEQAKEIKYAQGFTRPAPRDYVGEKPLSAPEARAMYYFTLVSDFALILAYHSQGEVIFWKYNGFEPRGSRALADEFSRVSGYAVEDTPYASGFAGYKDWFIEEYNRPGYTIETGRGTNPLPVSQLDDIYNKNIGILMTAALSQSSV